MTRNAIRELINRNRWCLTISMKRNFKINLLLFYRAWYADIYQIYMNLITLRYWTIALLARKNRILMVARCKQHFSQPSQPPLFKRYVSIFWTGAFRRWSRTLRSFVWNIAASERMVENRYFVILKLDGPTKSGLCSFRAPRRHRPSPLYVPVRRKTSELWGSADIKCF